ncbi:hypothetical protein ONZ45_g7967 [Pleurotus djamor]|nr:hypothetical protein ONZ45_g7967 [Pleurotus djamor]
MNTNGNDTVHSHEPQTNPEAETIEQQEIDDQISQLHAQIHSLKTKRNACARICRLPPEIIAKIFILAKWASIINRRARHSELPRIAFSPERGWLNIAGVCTYWRDIALDCPRLWSTITLTPVDRALAMISRSKSAPLFIESSPILANHDFDKVASIVMSNIHRIQELDIGGRDDQKLFEFLRLNEGASASILQVLTLRSPMDSTLPKDILEREMGSLRELHIFDGTLASPIPPFPRLKRLVIEPSYLLVGVLLESLRNAQNLEEVRVRRVHVPTDIVTLSAVHLPRLTHLDIHGLTIATSKILPLLKRPPTVNFTYHCQEPLPSGCDMSNIRNALVQFVSHPGRVIRNVSVNTHNPFSIVLDTVLHSDSHSFEVTLRRHPINRDDELDQLLSVIPFAKIPSLTLINGSKAIASRLFRLCDEVNVLTLMTYEPAVFRALQKKVKYSKHPLPKLRRLVVDQCRCPNGLTARMWTQRV